MVCHHAVRKPALLDSPLPGAMLVYTSGRSVGQVFVPGLTCVPCRLSASASRTWTWLTALQADNYLFVCSTFEL